MNRFSEQCTITDNDNRTVSITINALDTCMSTNSSSKTRPFYEQNRFSLLLREFEKWSWFEILSEPILSVVISSVIELFKVGHARRHYDDYCNAIYRREWVFNHNHSSNVSEWVGNGVANGVGRMTLLTKSNIYVYIYTKTLCNEEQAQREMNFSCFHKGSQPAT